LLQIAIFVSISMMITPIVALVGRAAHPPNAASKGAVLLLNKAPPEPSFSIFGHSSKKNRRNH
jgi:hypothetical protein